MDNEVGKQCFNRTFVEAGDPILWGFFCMHELPIFGKKYGHSYNGGVWGVE